MKKTRLLALLVAVVLSVPFYAKSQSRPGDVDIFMGAELKYRDVFFNGRVFDFVVNLTPGVKWNMGHDWELGAQVLVPIINQFGNSYGDVRVGVASVAKQIGVGNRWRFKFSGGQFTYNRYGLDVKTMFIANKWLAFQGEVGMTGYCFFAFSDSWSASTPERLTFLAGPQFWIAPWTTQINVRGGRYVYGDYGVEIEAMRHFKHTTVGLFASYSSEAKENAGFRITVMLPPYKSKRRKVNFRPASNFQIDYRNDGSPYSTRQYSTDPEQNARQGWFSRDINPWGPDTMAPDFTYTDGDDRKEKEDKK